MQREVRKSRDTCDTLFFSTLREENCHFFRDTSCDTIPPSYLYFPADPLSRSYIPFFFFVRGAPRAAAAMPPPVGQPCKPASG